MSPRVRSPVERQARWSLGLAAAVAVFGHGLGRSSPTGGLLVALGEASLVGGLADWFAVRALFVRPLGIPWHTAIIPRNKERLIREIRVLVLEQWLPPRVFAERIQSVDLAAGLTALARDDALRRPVVRRVLASLALALDPADLAALLARPLADRVVTLDLAARGQALVERARRDRWLEPLAHRLLERTSAWMRSPAAERVLDRFLRDLYQRYKSDGLLRRVMGRLGEILGVVDLTDAARALQAEFQTLLAAQTAADSDFSRLLDQGLEDLSRRLREDPEFRGRIEAGLRQQADAATFHRLLEPLLASGRDEALQDLAGERSALLDGVLRHLDRTLEGLSADPQARDAANRWCRERLIALLSDHHGLLGDLVERQLRAYSDADLVGTLEARLGDDLNWIRINGAVVGGLLGALFHGIGLLVERTRH